MTVFKLAVDFAEVDAVTGVKLRFQGRIKGKGGISLFNDSIQLTDRSSFVFSEQGRGNVLKGKLSFETVGDAFFSDEGQLYSFVNPGEKAITIRANRPDDAISIELSKASPHDVVLTPDTFFGAGDLELLAPVIDPLA